MSEDRAFTATSSGGVFTGRQMEVASLLAVGKSHSAIGRDLGISQGTVGTYVSQMAAKLPGRGPASTRVVIWFYTRST